MAEATRAIESLANEQIRAARIRTGEGYFRGVWRRLSADKLSLAALIVLFGIIAVSVAAPAINDGILHQDPNRGRLTQRFRSPSGDHLLGTDDFGRDELARLLVAGRVSLGIGFLSMAISLGLGVALGVIAAYYGKFVDDTVNALVQIINNIPTLFLLIMLAVVFRPNVFGLAAIIGLTGWTGTTRLIRARVLSERRRDYVDAAITSGASPPRVMARHILPNVGSLVLLVAGGDVIGAILAESGISYLGFGVQIPTASWGNMLSKSFDYFTQAPWLVVVPGAMVMLTILCLFQLTDGLRDALDPYLQA